ncbi:MAG: hypothetical protein P8Q48_12965 [Paracoccaceae bacterium]|jgi:cyclophilin family peptidyl-prolyl cis-trans isomerase|nr:hypothetical protein [Paracoccaceae bacterium]MDG1371128.1 hypothetical protein [Paracoccaceae bacterium]
MRLSFLHTGDIHVATFEALAADLGYDGVVSHRVEQHLLDRARSDGLDTVRDETHKYCRNFRPQTLSFAHVRRLAR